MKDDDLIILGCLGRVHGIKGFITVHSYTEPRENILNYKDWYFFIDKHWQPLDVLQVEVNDKHILVKIAGFAEREDAGKLTHVKIGVIKEELPVLTEGEFYWHDLIGLSVINTEGVSLGTVEEIMPTGSNDVLVLKKEELTILIPYLPENTIVSVDLKERKMIVAWDEDW